MIKNIVLNLKISIIERTKGCDINENRKIRTCRICTHLNKKRHRPSDDHYRRTKTCRKYILTI